MDSRLRVRARAPIPPAIVVLFAIDLLLAASYYINYLAGRPFWMLNIQLDLGAETNFTTWYASAKWLLVGASFGVLAYRGFQKRAPSAYVMLLPVLLCLMLSADEVARVHEWIGRRADRVLLPGGSRYSTPLLRTGIWMFLLVPPVAVAVWIGVRFVFRFYSGAQASRLRALVGWVGFFGAAGGLELLSNVTAGNAHLSVLQVLAEESGELLAVTVICWSQLELLRGAGVRIVFDSPGATELRIRDLGSKPPAGVA